MKIGLILECAPDGPDKKVCEHLLERLLPDVEVVSVTLGNKPNLIARCGDTAAQLLQDSCQRVIIVWDLYPPWRPRGENPCRREDREEIFTSLDQAGVSLTNIHLVCICEELEAWLLADRRAITAAISRMTGRQARITDTRRPELVRNPKAKLDNIFRQHTHRQYQGHNHAIKIIRELPDLTKIMRCQSFARFALKATGTEYR
jgi:hypothetical protein